MYLEIDEGYFEHPKTLDLCARLQDSKACVYPLRLWKWACRSAKSGKLGKISAFALEKAVDYEPMDGKCFDAMCSSVFIDMLTDGTFEIHDWMEYTGGALKRMEEKASENRRRREEGKRRYEEEQTRQRTGIVPVQSENHTGTNLTQTRQDKTSPDKTSLQIEQVIAASAAVSYRRRKAAEPTEGFVKFWEAYPLKKAKGQALKAWPGDHLLDRMLQALEWQAPGMRAQMAIDPSKVKHPATWLNALCWEDEKTAQISLLPSQRNGNMRTQEQPKTWKIVER